MQKISISSSGLRNVLQLKLPQDFEFIVGGVSYKCSCFLASYLSPRVANQLSSDRTNCSFIINIDDRNNVFKKIVSFMEGYSIIILEDEREIIMNFGKILGNEQIVKECMRFPSPTLENALECLEFQIKHEILDKNTLDFAAENLCSFTQDKIVSMSTNMFELILQNKKLRISNENQLFSLVNLYLKCNISANANSLLGYIMIENLSSSNLQKFILLLNGNDISGNIWRGIQTRLMNEATGKQSFTSEIPHEFEKSIEYNTERDGIFSYLNETYEGNLCHKGIIGLFSSSFYSVNNEDMIDKSKNGTYGTNNRKKSFITFDFKDRSILLSHYTIQSYQSARNNAHLKNWKIQGSHDGINFVTIDKQINCEALNGPEKISTFTISEKKNYQPYRFIRLIAGKNWRNDYYILLSNIEFYGTIYKIIENTERR